MAEPAAAYSSSSGSFAPRPRRLHGARVVRDELPYTGLATAAPPPPPLPPVQVQAAASGGGGGGGGGGGKISPAVLFIIVILAVVFFISGLLHLLVRVLMKKQHRRGGGRGGTSSSSAAAAAGRGAAGGEADVALQRQLQQLFHLHDSGLDQAFIDALPVFAYREIVGGGGDKEPFDCAVCLCEFDAEDRLRLLPLCGHAFHLGCIDTWLLSNSTCPLCRGVLFVPGLMGDDDGHPMFDFEERLEEGRLSSEDCDDGFGLPGLKGASPVAVAEKKVFPVRLGKFKNVGTQGAVEGGNANASARVLSRDQGESSSSSLDGRRCFSMGTYQYVLGTSELRVALQPGRIRNGAGGAMRARPPGLSSINADIMEGKKICARNKGESFSVSKIWQWSNLKGKLPAGSDECSDAGSLPWMKRGGGAADTSNS